MFNSINEIKLANKRRSEEKGFAYWFAKGAMRFFDTKIETGVIDGQYFVTSEVNPSYEKRFTIRTATKDGQILTVGDFHSHNTLKEAKQELRSLNQPRRKK